MDRSKKLELNNFWSSMPKDFYYLQNDEMQMMEKGINSAKIKIQERNIVSIKDIYSFYGTQAFVKTYVTFFFPTFHNSYTSAFFPFSFKKVPDFQFSYCKLSNVKKDVEVNTSGSRVSLEVPLSLKPGEYFGTMELYYSFPINYNKDGYYTITIEDRGLIEGCLYVLYVQKDLNERKCSFYRNDLEIQSSEEYHHIIKTPYKKYSDQYQYNYIYVYK